MLLFRGQQIKIISLIAQALLQYWYISKCCILTQMYLFWCNIIILVLLVRSIEFKYNFYINFYLLSADKITWLLFSCINLNMRWFCLLDRDLPVVVWASLLVAWTCRWTNENNCYVYNNIICKKLNMNIYRWDGIMTCTLCCEFRTVDTAAVVVVLWMQHCILSPFVAFVSGHPHSSCLLSAACRAFLCFSINWVTMASTVSAV